MIDKEKTENKYNYGIDVLKIVATFMIIAMHIMGQGGLLKSTEVGSVNYYIAWTIECISFVGVNLYALGTGYLNAKKNVKVSSFVKRWLQVFFYTFLFTALFTILMPGVVSLKSWAKAFIPILSNYYWYFTQYFVLFMFMPYLNKMMNSLNRETFKRLVLAIIFVLSFLPMIRQYDLFLTGNGFSAWWLIALYIIGGYFSWYKDEIKYPKKFLWGCILVSNVIAVGSKILIDILMHVDVNNMENYALIYYTSLPMVISSIAIFLLASNMKVNRNKRTIKFLGSTTFGIYLFHVNYFIWAYIISNLFSFMGTLNPIMMLLGIIGSDIAIFLIGMIFEFLRAKFFEVAHINKFGEWCGSKIEWLVDNYGRHIL